MRYSDRHVRYVSCFGELKVGCRGETVRTPKAERHWHTKEYQTENSESESENDDWDCSTVHRPHYTCDTIRINPSEALEVYHTSLSFPI